MGRSVAQGPSESLSVSPSPKHRAAPATGWPSRLSAPNTAGKARLSTQGQSTQGQAWGPNPRGFPTSHWPMGHCGPSSPFRLSCLPPLAPGA